MSSTRDRFLAVEEDINSVLFEREAEVHSALLALASRRHLFMVGAPGIAKSMLVDQLVKRIKHLEGEAYFKVLLTKFTNPEELFGPPDFNLMKEEGIYKRNTEGYLPRAIIAFLDEIFKANSAILNALLTALNEKVFYNHDDDPSIPLQSVFAASNEIPTTAELEALADRLHFWHHVKPINDPSNFAKMLQSQKVEPEAFISVQDIYIAQHEVDAIVVPDSIIEVLIDLAQKMREENITVSDRRFHQSIAIIQAEAWLNGHERAEVLDVKPLVNVLWRDVSQISTVRKIVLDLADPLEREIIDLRDEVEKVYSSFLQTVADVDNPSKKLSASIEAIKKVNSAKEEYAKLRKQQNELGRDSKHLNSLKVRLKSISEELLQYSLNNKTDTKSLQAGDGLDD